MTTVLRFTVPGEPMPKERARARAVTMPDGRAIATMYTPSKTKGYESKVRDVCQLAINQQRWVASDRERFELHVVVYRTHEGAGGDLDNYVKAISDAINKVAFPDDRYVRKVSALLVQDARAPRVEVEVRRMRVGEAAAASGW